MSRSRILGVLLFLAMAFSMSVPLVRAGAPDQATKVKFSEAVELPGHTLPAGTYWFVVVRNDDYSRNTVRIFSEDKSVLYATLLTVPSVRFEASGRTVFTFAERTDSKPQALLAWFYPDETAGHEFIYPKNEETELSRDIHQEVVAEPVDISARAGQ
jgi:hypothetical protein